MFNYHSNLVLSKSWLNRALIIEHFSAEKFLNFKAESDDVQVLVEAIKKIETSNEFYLGQGGTSFRFFCFLISRRPGRWSVKAHPRLFARPQQGLAELLSQLGIKTDFYADRVEIQSQGWVIPENFFCSAHESSQFISGLLLSSWDLEKDLSIEVRGNVVSEDYLKMTIQMLKNFGMTIEQGAFLRVPKKQIPQPESKQAEVDVSSAFSLCAAAAVDGHVEILNWSKQSMQPDHVFLEIFNQMGIVCHATENKLQISKQTKWRGISVDLQNSPDLFPVLAVLCALAEGTSDLHGAEQLRHKESDRLQKTKELLDLTGFKSDIKKDGLVIQGRSSTQDLKKPVTYDPDHDHRMAMAAGVLKLAGFHIQVLHPEVVEKSYPDFWKDIGFRG